MFEPSEEIVDLRERLQLDVRLHLTSYYKAKNFLRILATATEANYDALFETVAVFRRIDSISMGKRNHPQLFGLTDSHRKLKQTGHATQLYSFCTRAVNDYDRKVLLQTLMHWNAGHFGNR